MVSSAWPLIAALCIKGVSWPGTGFELVASLSAAAVFIGLPLPRVGGRFDGLMVLDEASLFITVSASLRGRFGFAGCRVGDVMSSLMWHF